MSLVFSGGGGGKSHQTDDNLRSEDNAELLLGLCEGPIVGLENGEKSFYIEDTPLRGSDNSKNFDDFELEIKKGDASQDETIKFKQGGVGKGHVVNLEIKKNTGTESYISRETDSADIDYIDVRLGIDSLVETSSKGNTYNATGEFKIEYRKTTESSWHLFNDGILYITGKTTSPFYKDFRIRVTRDTTPNVKYEIKVTRVSEPSSESSSGYFFKLRFVQYEEIDASTKEFKNTALAHINIRTSDQVNSIPQMYGIYKLLKVKIPSNYDPQNHTYNGLWDGTFKIDWTDNPAWCLYDLIVNDRYGVNAYYPVTPDKWDFYEAGKYCDELVDNGKGGNEPRYTFNYLITESQPGPDMLNYIAGTFNAIMYEDSMGLLRLHYEDNEKPAVQIFNPTNITSEGFSYSFTDPSTRYNDFTVTFLNPSLNWEEDRRRVITPYGDENINLYGRIPYDFNAIGCTKESEALRKARFKLIGSVKETMSVNFSTNRAAMNVNLFDTILIADPDMMYSQTGRIKSISEDRYTVYLRDFVYLEPEVAYEFNIQTSYNVFRCSLIVNEFGKTKELKLDNSLPDNVDEKAVFTLSGTAGIYGNPKPFRVMSISENQGNPDQISISALEIHRLKQQEADDGIELIDEQYYSAPNIMIIPQIKDALFEEYFNADKLQNALRIGVVLDWDSYPYYTGEFVVYSRLKDDDNPIWTRRTLEEGNVIYGHPAGLYEFKILPYNTLGNTSSLESAPIFEFNVSEIAAEPPLAVNNFTATGNVENIHLTWDKVEGAVRYELRLGNDWDTADIISSNILPSNGLTEEFYYTDVESDNSYRFMIKPINIAGLYSNYASVAYGSLSAPADVKKFYITPNLDSLRFDWETENENYVSYEVRTGAQGGWESATTLFTTQGNNQTVLNPGFNEDTYFYIKGISRKGIYSENALWGKIKQNLKQNRNVVLEVNNDQGRLNYFINSPENYSEQLTPWYGITYGLVDIQAGAKLMADGYSSAEHFFPIHIPNSSGNDTVARNWYDVEFFKLGQRLTWEDLNWAWNSDEAKSTSWLNGEYSEASGAKLETLITTAKNTDEYNNYLGFRFNNTVNDVRNEITPNVAYKIAYMSGKYDKGLAIYKAMKLNYDLTDFNEEFSFRFKVHLTPSIPNFTKLVRLSDDTMSNYLDVYFEDSNIKVVRSDGVSIIEPFDNSSYLDFMFIMITQDDNKLYLDYFIEYANIRKRLEVDCQPLTTFTKLYFGSRYD